MAPKSRQKSKSGLPGIHLWGLHASRDIQDAAQAAAKEMPWQLQQHQVTLYYTVSIQGNRKMSHLMLLKLKTSYTSSVRPHTLVA